MMSGECPTTRKHEVISSLPVAASLNVSMNLGNQTDKGLLGSRTDLFHDVGRMPDNSKTRSDFESARGCITQCINESGNLRELLLAWFPSRTSSMMLVEQ